MLLCLSVIAGAASGCGDVGVSSLSSSSLGEEEEGVLGFA